ncbi:ABC transporter ATP-binding protein [Cohnella sp. GCM10020058]|uniref:ABC transporter ATP-binding protein n=1 Tax=Cohnella sp. GCM10020058 TaxID=3317330 RepID=UPI00363C0E0F
MSNFRWIIANAKKVKIHLIFFFFLLIVEMATKIGVVGIQKFIVDDLFVKGKYHLLLPLLSGLMLIAIISNLYQLFAALMRNQAAFTLQQIMLKDILKLLHRMSVKQFRKHRTGKYVTNLTSDLDQTTMLIANTLPLGIMQICEAIILSIIIGSASPVLLVSVMGVSLVYLAIGKFLAPKLKSLNNQVANSNTALLITVEEGISSSREVIAFNRQDWENKRIRKYMSEHFNNIMEQLKITNKQAFYSLIMLWSIQLFVLGYGGYLVFQKDLSIGWLVIIFQFSSQLMNSYEKVYSFFVGFVGNMAFVERVREVTEEEKTNCVELISKPIRSLSFHKVTFRYDSNEDPVIRDMDLNIPVGKKVALVGMSGSGKSTIAQLLIRFYEPDSGFIAVNNKPLSQVSIDQWSKQVTFVSQDSFLFPDSIRNNLLLGREISETHMIEICKRLEIHEFIESLSLGYDTDVGERGVQLSGGQRQLIALARALLVETEIMILDESTSSLDLETERHIFNELDKLRKGKTTIVIAHRLSTIKNADIVYVISDGRIIECGDHNELITKDGVYSQLVKRFGNSIPTADFHKIEMLEPL